MSVIVPIYNEQVNLPEAVEEIDRFLEQHFSSHEIIIVESGSTDRSGQLCDELALRRPAVRVHHEGRRNGFGSALRTGFSMAGKDWVWPVVVDKPYPLQTVLTALPFLDRYDCVLSYRVNDRRSAYRRTQSAVYSWLVRVLLGVRARHVNSAFKFIKRSRLQALPLTTNGWLLDAELVLAIEERRASYVEIPVELHDRVSGQSTVNAWAAVRTLGDLLGLRWRRRSAR